MKKSILFVTLIISFGFLHAGAQKNHNDANALIILNRDLHSFTKNYLLNYIFPKKVFFDMRAKEDFDHYSTRLRHVSIGSKNSDEQKILGKFNGIKGSLEGLAGGKVDSSRIDDVMDMEYSLDGELEQMINRSMGPLTSNQKIKHSLAMMGWYLEGAACEYLANEISVSTDKNRVIRLQENINKFEKNLETYRMYGGGKNKNIIRVDKVWSRLKAIFSERGFPLIVYAGINRVKYLLFGSKKNNSLVLD